MAYEWCSAISEATGRLGETETQVIEPRFLRDHILFLHIFRPHDPGVGLRFRLRQPGQQHKQDADLIGLDLQFLSSIIEEEFSKVGPDCDPVRLDDASHRARRGISGDLTPLGCAHLLSIALEIGFRLTEPGHNQPFPHLNHTSHRDWVSETAFSSDDDEVIADAVCVWIADRGHISPASFMGYFAKRVEKDTPFSPRLRRVGIYAIGCIWRDGPKVSVLEIVPLLDRLEVDADDVVEKNEWVQLLVDLIYSPEGPMGSPSHHWRLLDKLMSFIMIDVDLEPRGLEVMRSLGEAEDWEKLEIWVAIGWRSPRAEPMEEVGRVTLKLLSQRPSALRRFEGIYEVGIIWWDRKIELGRMCEQARAKHSPSESLPLYVLVCLPAPICSNAPFSFSFSCFSQSVRAQQLVPLPFAGDDTF